MAWKVLENLLKRGCLNFPPKEILKLYVKEPEFQLGYEMKKAGAALKHAEFRVSCRSIPKKGRYGPFFMESIVGFFKMESRNLENKHIFSWFSRPHTRPGGAWNDSKQAN